MARCRGIRMAPPRGPVTWGNPLRGRDGQPSHLLNVGTFRDEFPRALPGVRPVDTMVGPVTHAIVGYTERSLRPVQCQYREDWSVNDPITTRFVGLDVHKETIAVAVADRSLPAKVLSTIPNDLAT